MFFSKAIELDSFSLPAYVERVEAYFKMENYYNATKDLNEIFNSAIADVNKGKFYDDFWRRAYTIRGKIHEKNGDYEKAESDYTKAESFQ